MRKWLLAALLALAAPAALAAPRPAECWPAKLADSSGQYLMLSTGMAYEVLPAGRNAAVLWFPSDRLIVCIVGGNLYAITNLTRHGVTVRALFLD